MHSYLLSTALPYSITQSIALKLPRRWQHFAFPSPRCSALCSTHTCKSLCWDTKDPLHSIWEVWSEQRTLSKTSCMLQQLPRHIHVCIHSTSNHPLVPMVWQNQSAHSQPGLPRPHGSSICLTYVHHRVGIEIAADFQSLPTQKQRVDSRSRKPW